MKNETPNMPETNDPLDELLRGADEYLPDHGFTARVIASLPVKRSHSWRRLIVLSVAMLIGGALVAWQWPAVLAVFNPAPDHSPAFQWHTLIVFVPLLAALVSLAPVVLAIVSEEE